MRGLRTSGGDGTSGKRESNGVEGDFRDEDEADKLRVDVVRFEREFVVVTRSAERRNGVSIAEHPAPRHASLIRRNLDLEVESAGGVDGADVCDGVKGQISRCAACKCCKRDVITARVYCKHNKNCKKC